MARKTEIDLHDAVTKAGVDDKALNPSLWLRVKSMIPFLRMQGDEAFMQLLELSVIIDREAHPDEVAELAALTDRSRFLRKLDLDNRKRYLAIRQRVDARKGNDVKEEDRWKHVMEACLAIPGAMRKSIFAHVVDLLFADRRFVEAERKLITLLGRLLKIPRTESEPILDVLRAKNEIPHKDPSKPSWPSPGLARSKRLEEGGVVTDQALRELWAFSPEAAHYALLKCAVWADKIKNQPESNELAALWRAPSLAACSDPLRDAIVKYVREAADALGYEKLFAKALEYVDRSIAIPIYAQAVDLVMVDQYIAPEELKFLEKLRKELGVNVTESEKIIRVLKAKNAY